METWAQYIRTYEENEEEMSEFAEACRRLIDTSGTNVYQIAKRSGLDRTTLQKMVQGTRLPSRTFVEQFCEYLLINNAERSELLELFQMEKVGRERYLCRCEVENLLCNFQNLKNSLDDTVYRRSIRIERGDAAAGLSPPVRRLSTDVDIVTAIQYIILNACADDGTVPVYLDIFPNAEYAMQQILQERQRGAHVRCCQFINFYHKNGSRHGLQQNVKTLHTVLSCAFAAPDGYEIRYFYKMIDEPDFCRIWPHYLITRHHVLLLAEDGKSGILIEEEDIAREYLTRLGGMRKKGKNLLAYSGSAEQMLAGYGEKVFKGKMTLSFDTMLCMGDIVSRVIEEKLSGVQDADESGWAEAEIISTGKAAAGTGTAAGTGKAAGADAAAQDQEKRLRSLEEMYRRLCLQRDTTDIFASDYRRFCCMNGLDEFLEDGTLPGVYGEFLGPVDEELRAKVLREYIRSMEERENEYILKDDLGIPADGLNIELYEPNRVFIYSTRQDLPLGCVCIEEPGIFLVFKDYFDSLEEEEKAYSVQESLQILKKRCKKLVEKYFPGGVCSAESEPEQPRQGE